MSYESPIEIVENDVLVVAVCASDGTYFMWQRGLTEWVGASDGVYFEFNDQINGGHNLVTKCTVTSDGVDVVLSNGKSKHLTFPPGFDKHEELRIGLRKVFAEQNSVLEFRI